MQDPYNELNLDDECKGIILGHGNVVYKEQSNLPKARRK